MLWFLLALIGAVLDATYYLLVKRAVKGRNEYVAAGGVFFSAGLILLVIALFQGIPAITPQFYTALLGTVSINIIASVLYFKALRTTDLSLSVPMLSFSPIFLVFTSFIMLQEFPTTHGIAGIVLIVLGSYVLNTTNRKTHVLEPLRAVWRNKGIFFMLIVAFLFSITSNFDKLAVKNSSAIFGSAMIELALGISFMIIALFKNADISGISASDIRTLFLPGAVLAAICIAVNTALLLQIVPYVVSVKRLSILFSVVFGALFYKEKHIVNKLAGAVIMIMGVMLILLF